MLIPGDKLLSDELMLGNTKNLIQKIEQSIVPHSDNEFHYAQARGTDSALLCKLEANKRRPATTNSPGESHFEKFLFYRGVGKFDQPVSVTYGSDSNVKEDEIDKISVNDDETPRFTNNSPYPISAALWIEVDGDEMTVTKSISIEPRKSMKFGTAMKSNTEELSRLVIELLMNEGLYRKEAQSMVRTWDASWFTEPGSRILYVVPPQLTDELLPLHIVPAPEKSLRVLVGRLEILSPGKERDVIDALKENANKRSELIAEFKEGQPRVTMPLPAIVEKFGRMAEAVIARAATLTNDPLVRDEANRLRAEHFTPRNN